MGIEENKAVVRRFVEEVQNRHNLDAIDDLVAPDFVNRLSQIGSTDRSTLKEGTRGWFDAFPDVRAEVHAMIAEGDKVVTFKTFHGTHRGEVMGIAPTGRTIALHVIDIMRVVDGTIVEHWGIADRMDLLEQLGAAPSS